jgi:uncharacterized coiled-coil protein SlyX
MNVQTMVDCIKSLSSQIKGLVNCLRLQQSQIDLLSKRIKSLEESFTDDGK